MARTTAALVQGVLQGDYGPNPVTGALPDLNNYIAIASPIVDRVVACSILKNRAITDTGVGSEAEVCERWLAAHYYTKMDPVYSARTTGGASGTFVRDKDCPEPYLNGAINVDYSGCLKAIIKRQFADATALGNSGSRDHYSPGRDC